MQFCVRVYVYVCLVVSCVRIWSYLLMIFWCSILTAAFVLVVILMIYRYTTYWCVLHFDAHIYYVAYVCDLFQTCRRYQNEALRDEVNNASFSDGAAAKPLLEERHFRDIGDDADYESDDDDDARLLLTTHSTYYWVYQQIRIPVWSVFCTFTVTLSLFPAITVLIVSENKCENNGHGNRIYNDLFIPFMLFLFNLFDFLGRVSANHVMAWVTPHNMWVPTLLRLAFFPLVLFCNIDGTVLPIAFNSDVLAMVILSALGLTNGLLASLAMMAGPASVAPRHKSIAATVMLFSLTMGLCCGSFLSFGTLYISQGSF